MGAPLASLVAHELGVPGWVRTADAPLQALAQAAQAALDALERAGLIVVSGASVRLPIVVAARSAAAPVEARDPRRIGAPKAGESKDEFAERLAAGRRQWEAQQAALSVRGGQLPFLMPIGRRDISAGDMSDGYPGDMSADTFMTSETISAVTSAAACFLPEVFSQAVVGVGVDSSQNRTFPAATPTTACAGADIPRDMSGDIVPPISGMSPKSDIAPTVPAEVERLADLAVPLRFPKQRQAMLVQMIAGWLANGVPPAEVEAGLRAMVDTHRRDKASHGRGISHPNWLLRLNLASRVAGEVPRSGFAAPPAGGAPGTETIGDARPLPADLVAHAGYSRLGAGDQSAARMLVGMMDAQTPGQRRRSAADMHAKMSPDGFRLAAELRPGLLILLEPHRLEQLGYAASDAAPIRAAG